MQRPRPSNIFIRAFGLILASLAIFVIGLMIFNATKQARESPEVFEEPEQGLLD